MAKLNICHLFATALVLIRSQRRKIKKKKKIWIRSLFDGTLSGKKMSDKIDEIFRGNENFVRPKFCPTENFV